MTDLHCHILHGMDDGSSGLEESLELCRIAFDNRIEHIVATPHISEAGQAESFLRKRNEKLTELREALALRNIRVELHPGAEILAGDGLLSDPDLRKLTINGSRYLLVEFPWADLDGQTLLRHLAAIRGQGLAPIIAHPERYLYFQRDYGFVNLLLEQGVLFQVNAPALFRPASRAEGRLARELVRRKAASFLATDAHSVDYRPNNLLDMLGAASSLLEYDGLDCMVSRNPELVLRDGDLAAEDRAPIRKHWGG